MDNEKLKNRLNGKINPAKQNPATGPAADKAEIAEEKAETMQDEANNELATVETDYIALKNNVLDIISDNLKNQPLSFQLFDTVKSPSGGATVFTVPGLSGDELVKELSGIIIDYTTPRAYWDTPDPVEGQAPNCFSHDSLISIDGRPCSRCEFNTFGSKDGESGAKACKESVLLFLLRPDNIIPLIVRVPVSSKILFQKFATRLCSSLTPIHSIVTKITLEKATSKEGKPYAKYVFEAADALSAGEAASAKAFGQRFMEIINTADQTEVMEAA
jgi:hypothetical protein